ncbi:MAG: hypothetical protein ACE5G5_13265 [Candidatus Methylomirabilales bacterium]
MIGQKGLARPEAGGRGNGGLLVLFTVFALAVGALPQHALATSCQSREGKDAAAQQATGEPQKPQQQAQGEAEEKEDEFLKLGTRENYQDVERYNTAQQINAFIPPLYQPVFVGHGYVLPPGALQVALHTSFFDIDSDDFFKGGKIDPVHENHQANRLRVDFDLFYGLDRNMTLFVNLPYFTSNSKGSVHPAGVMPLDLFAEGNSQSVGDATIVLKKKWVDQGNFLFNFATVTGLKLPTGSDDEQFDAPLVVRMPNGSLTTAFGGGPFPRFTDNGSLPQALQPGTGGFGYVLGAMGTRQFLGFRSAFHSGVLLRMLNGQHDVDPGDEVRFFASYVKPFYKEQWSLDLTFNGMSKGKDQYGGTFTHPVPNADGGLAGIATTPRPPFQGGTVLFFSPGLIWSPDPQVRVTGRASFRLNQPELGPWPGTIVEFGVSYILPIFGKKINY